MSILQFSSYGPSSVFFCSLPVSYPSSSQSESTCCSETLRIAAYFALSPKKKLREALTGTRRPARSLYPSLRCTFAKSKAQSSKIDLLQTAQLYKMRDTSRSARIAFAQAAQQTLALVYGTTKHPSQSQSPSFTHIA